MQAGRWVEVTHVPDATRLNSFQERRALWMYQAHGSGLWYWTGRTLVVSDTADLAAAVLGGEYQNRSQLLADMKKRGLYSWKDALIDKVLKKLQAEGYEHAPIDSVELNRKVQLGSLSYKHELLALTSTTESLTACPRSTSWRTGLKHSRYGNWPAWSCVSVSL